MKTNTEKNKQKNLRMNEISLQFRVELKKQSK